MKKNIPLMDETELIEIIKESRVAKDRIRDIYLPLLIEFLKNIFNEGDAEEMGNRVLEIALHSCVCRPYFSSFDVWLFSWVQDNLHGKKLSKTAFFSFFENIDLQEERKLLENYIKGEDASSVLYKRYSKFVAAKLIQAGGSRKDLEDLSQEIFQLAFSNICHLKNPAAFKCWLGKICSHHAYRHRKNSEKIQEFSLDEFTVNNSGKLCEKLTVHTNPLAESLKEEEISSLKKELNRLDEKYKIIIYLKYFKNMTYKEISRILKLDSNTLHKRIFYGLKKLRDALSSPAKRGSYIELP